MIRKVMQKWYRGKVSHLISSKNPNKKEITIELGNPLYSVIPEWLQEFWENLVDDEIPEDGDPHASSSHEVSLEPTFKRREDLCKHSVETHFPKDRNCELCKRTMITRAPSRKRTGEAVPRAENFGDLITAVYKVLNGEGESRNNNYRYAVVVQDSATQWIQCFQCKTFSSQESSRKIFEQSEKPKVIFSDNSLAFGKSCEESLYVNTTQIGNTWDCRKSSAQSERRYLCRIVAIRSG